MVKSAVRGFYFEVFWNICCFNIQFSHIFLLIIFSITTTTKGLPWQLGGKESACQCRRCRRHRFSLWVGKIPWGRKWQPIPVFLPEKFHGQWSLVVSQKVRCDWVTEHACIPPPMNNSLESFKKSSGFKEGDALEMKRGKITFMATVWLP